MPETAFAGAKGGSKNFPGGEHRPQILIISYLFPPAGGIAVQRALSLAKYLPAAGFNVHVLRAPNAAAPVQDPSLMGHIPAEVLVHDAWTPEIPFWFRHTIWKWLSRSKSHSEPGGSPSIQVASRKGGLRAFLIGVIRRILCPEPEILWYPFALRNASRVIRQYEIDVVLVTAPPFSAFVIGNELKRRFPEIKYCADFRDEWISFYLKDFDYQSGEYTRRRAIQIERETIESADLVVAVTESSLREIRSRYLDQPDSKFACISNGFDPEAFAHYEPRANNEKRLIVTHVGTAYKSASPQYYLDALDTLPAEIRENIETRFIGRISEGEATTLANRKSPVRILGFMPQSQALNAMEETDCLLLTMTNEISMPGKLYEYLAARKPIIALSPNNSEVHTFVEQTQSGWCVDHRDEVAIAALLEKLWHQKASGLVLSSPSKEGAAKRFERPELVRRYAALLRTS